MFGIDAILNFHNVLILSLTYLSYSDTILFYQIFLPFIQRNQLSFLCYSPQRQPVCCFPSLSFPSVSFPIPSFPFIYFPLLYSCFQHHITFSPSALYHILSLYFHFACPSSTPLNCTTLHSTALHCTPLQRFFSYLH